MDRLPAVTCPWNGLPRDIPKDVQFIIYRYLFDSQYSVVRREYTERWLNDIRWDDKGCFFEHGPRGYSIGNYRDPIVYAFESPADVHDIYRLTEYGPNVITRARLPRNYWYSIADLKKFILSLHGLSAQ